MHAAAEQCATASPPRYTQLINFRDFGGAPTRDGRRVKTDKVFRCGHLAHLDDAALEQITKLDFALVADLRYTGERQSEPSPWPLAYADRVLAHGGERTVDAPHLVMLRAGSLTKEAVEQFYLKFYQSLPFDALYRPLFARTMLRTSEVQGRVLVHCAAGKDRTGVLCALLLDVLGVAREDIFADYMRSANAPGLLAMKPMIIERSKRLYGHELPEAAVDALLGVKPAYLQAALAAIETQCGSVEAYLAESGIDQRSVQRLRATLLAD